MLQRCWLHLVFLSSPRSWWSPAKLLCKQLVKNIREKQCPNGHHRREPITAVPQPAKEAQDQLTLELPQMHHLLFDLSTKSSTKRSFFFDDNYAYRKDHVLTAPSSFVSQSHIAFVERGVKREGQEPALPLSHHCVVSFHGQPIKKTPHSASFLSVQCCCIHFHTIVKTMELIPWLTIRVWSPRKKSPFRPKRPSFARISASART